jgi:hypothetical protein
VAFSAEVKVIERAIVRRSGGLRLNVIWYRDSGLLYFHSLTLGTLLSFIQEWEIVPAGNDGTRKKFDEATQYAINCPPPLEMSTLKSICPNCRPVPKHP